MKFGVCTSVLQQADGAVIQNIAEIAAGGADYLELGIAGISTLSKTGMRQVQVMLSDYGLPALSGNVFFPGSSIRLVGEEFDHKAFLSYVDLVTDRAAELGIRTMVLGGAGARNYKYEMNKQLAMDEFCERLETIGDIAYPKRIRIAIEPLNRQESNLINSLTEGVNLAERLNHPAVGCLIDFYHMALSGQSPQDISAAGSLLWHVHIARTLGRNYPLYAAEEDYSSFFSALKAVNYKGNISIEGNTADIGKELPGSFMLLRQLWNDQEDMNE